MSDLSIRKEHRAGRITLTRPQALNALTHEMSLAIEQALDAWAGDDHVDLVVLDAEGDKAFCAGGDIAGIYHAGRAGDFAGPRAFWRDEYRMNAKIAHFPKPVVVLMQGFTMGGGVGLGGHAQHRIVCETTQIAMPECGIGLVPDVGGSLLLARAPDHWGEYLGLTGARMNAADAIAMGFADHHVPCAAWPGLIARLVETGDISSIPEHETAPEAGRLPEDPALAEAFALATLPAILDRLEAEGTDACRKAQAAVERASPLSVATTLALIRRSRKADTIEAALELEYRGTWRAIEQGDLLEGVRAQIIDKDRAPLWKHGDPRAVTEDEADAMLAPLGENTLNLGDTA